MTLGPSGRRKGRAFAQDAGRQGVVKRAALCVFLACFAGWNLGCTQQGRLLVVVDSDITDLAVVTMRVRRSSAAEGEVTDFMLSRNPLPLRFGVEPVGGSGLVRIEAVGRVLGGAPVVESAATINVVPGPTRVWQLFLDRACRGVFVCADDETCVAGECEPVPVVEPEELPTVAETAEAGQGDAGRLDGGGSRDASDTPPVDAQACSPSDGGSTCTARCVAPPPCCTAGAGPIPNGGVPTALTVCFANLGVAIDAATQAMLWPELEPACDGAGPCEITFALEAATGGLRSRIGWHWADMDPHDASSQFELFSCLGADRCRGDPSLPAPSETVRLDLAPGFAVGRRVAVWILVPDGAGSACSGSPMLNLWSTVPALSDVTADAHAISYIDPSTPDTMWIGFEDLERLGDFSYSDALIRVRGVSTTCR